MNHNFVVNEDGISVWSIKPINAIDQPLDYEIEEQPHGTSINHNFMVNENGISVWFAEPVVEKDKPNAKDML